MKKDPAMKMKKASMAKNKMKMVKGPDGKMVPDFAVDGNTCIKPIAPLVDTAL